MHAGVMFIVKRLKDPGESNNGFLNPFQESGRL